MKIRGTSFCLIKTNFKLFQNGGRFPLKVPHLYGWPSKSEKTTPILSVFFNSIFRLYLCSLLHAIRQTFPMFSKSPRALPRITHTQIHPPVLQTKNSQQNLRLPGVPLKIVLVPFRPFSRAYRVQHLRANLAPRLSSHLFSRPATIAATFSRKVGAICLVTRGVTIPFVFFLFFFSPRWKRSCLSMRKINYTNAARPVSFIHRFLSPRFLLRVISFILLACLRDVYNTWNIPFSILRFF